MENFAEEKESKGRSAPLVYTKSLRKDCLDVLEL